MNSQAKNNKSAKTAARNKLLEEVGNFHSVEDVDEKARIAEIVRQQYQTIYDRGNKHLGKPTTAKLIDIVCWTRNTTPSQLPKMGEKQVQSMISQWMAGKTVALPTDLPKKQQPDSASPATVAKSKASACNPSKGGKSKEAEGNTADEPKTTPTGDIVDVDQDVRKRRKWQPQRNLRVNLLRCHAQRWRRMLKWRPAKRPLKRSKHTLRKQLLLVLPLKGLLESFLR